MTIVFYGGNIVARLILNIEATMKHMDFSSKSNATPKKRLTGGVASTGKPTARDNSTAWLTGQLPLPDIYVIGKMCRNNHGIHGQSVRYRTNNLCVICDMDRHKRVKAKRQQTKVMSVASTNHRHAMDIYERQQERLLTMDMELDYI